MIPIATVTQPRRAVCLQRVLGNVVLTFMASITYVWCEKVTEGEGAIILNFLILMTFKWV